MNSIHFSSDTPEWETPKDFFDKLNSVYRFTLDPCCNRENCKCPCYYTMAVDGLKQSWQGHRVFMNPPYGRQIGRWMKKAYQESLGSAMVVCLVPSRTDTEWWHEYAMKGQIEFIRGRLKFGGSKTSAPFPSAVVVFKPNKPGTAS